MAHRTTCSSTGSCKQNIQCATDLINAYAHTLLAEETIERTSFSSGDKFFAFIRGFYGLRSLPNFFTKQMSSSYETRTEQGFA